MNEPIENKKYSHYRVYKVSSLLDIILAFIATFACLSLFLNRIFVVPSEFSILFS